MLVYPMSRSESVVVRWGRRIAPTLVVAAMILIATVSYFAAQ